MSRYIDADELHSQGWVAARYINWEPTPLNDNFRLEVEVKPFTTFYAADIPRWIPVTERLPEREGRYLVTSLYGGLHVETTKWFFTTFDGGFFLGDLERNYVVAWMPLPEPYKGGEEE